MSDQEDFYLAFEEQFRGSREEILARLTIYEDCVRALQEVYPDARALDLGCGRGEWLELMRSWGVSAKGVDISSRMVQECTEKGLPARRGDLIEELKHAEPDSFHIITSFHVIEHLDAETLKTMFFHAHRALVPHGLLILETQNPENIYVGANTFYIDPTHMKPIPPALLSFLGTFYEFNPAKIFRLQQNLLPSNAYTGLQYAVFGSSPDYALVGLRASDTPPPDSLSRAIHTQHGVSFAEAVERHDQLLSEKLHKLETQSAQQKEQIDYIQRQLDNVTNNSIVRSILAIVGALRGLGKNK